MTEKGFCFAMMLDEYSDRSLLGPQWSAVGTVVKQVWSATVSQVWSDSLGALHVFRDDLLDTCV